VSPAKIKAAIEANASSPVKAWVNFDGTGTVSIRESLNVSSITDNGNGDYTINFATALVDANYVSLLTKADGALSATSMNLISQTSSSARVGSSGDKSSVFFAAIR